MPAAKGVEVMTARRIPLRASSWSEQAAFRFKPRNANSQGFADEILAQTLKAGCQNFSSIALNVEWKQPAAKAVRRDARHGTHPFRQAWQGKLARRGGFCGIGISRFGPVAQLDRAAAF
jgi:hypothetical protein